MAVERTRKEEEEIEMAAIQNGIKIDEQIAAQMKKIKNRINDDKTKGKEPERDNEEGREI